MKEMSLSSQKIAAEDTISATPAMLGGDLRLLLNSFIF